MAYGSILGQATQSNNKKTGDTMKFQQIRSATAIITYGGVRFLIDPWLSEKDAYPPIPGSPHPELRCPIHELPMPVEKIMETEDKINSRIDRLVELREEIEMRLQNLPDGKQKEVLYRRYILCRLYWRARVSASP